MNKAPVVFKFGGSSLESADRLLSAVEQIARFEGPLVVVTSALGRITDLLAQFCNTAGDAVSISEQVQATHIRMAADLDLPEALLSDYGVHVETTLQALSTARGPVEGQERDEILSVGERLSTNLVAHCLSARQLRGIYVDSRTIIRTGSQWGNARVDLTVTRRLIGEKVSPLLNNGDIPVVTGFLGSNAAGETTTIGRNGSDLTATVLGACLEASEVWIWTDVDGILTADPRHHQSARVLPEISFREAAEVAYFGASVIHPRTLWPLLETEVAVRIKNLLAPENEGTLISSRIARRGRTLITTSIDDVSMITVGGYGMIGVPGVAATIFSAVQEVGTNVLMISQSSAEHNITFVVQASEVPQTIDSLETALADWLEGDRRIDHIRVLSDVGIITVVGENMRNRHGIAGKIFSALGHQAINVIAIAQGSSEYSISMVLEKDNLRLAVDCIHSELDDENDN
ncbi:MAG: aspartate kinase [Candidatus Marinimicrobia bacterium]|nr:aspartate kinase [Candidatus Neomarinimicrobiota bacterium]